MRFGLASVGKKGGKHDRDKWRGSSITENLIICTFFCKLTVNSNSHTRGEFRAYRFGVQVLAVLVVVYILQVLAVLYILQVMAVLYLFIYFIVDE